MKTIVTLIIAALFPFVVNAEVPKWYKSGVVKGEGTVVSIDIKQRLIMIDDQHMKLSSKIKVHSPAQEFVPLGKIQSGQLIGFNYEPNDNGKIEITEIWIIDKEIMSQLDKASNKASGTNDRKENITGAGAIQNKKADKERSWENKGSRPPLRVSQ